MSVPGESLSVLINTGSTACLNEASAHPVAHCLEDEKQLRSDADPQLLLNLDFTEPVHLSGLRLAATGDEAPRVIKLFVNRLNMGFEDADSEPAAQEVLLQLENETETVVRLSPLRFKNVHSLVIFVEENGGAEVTSLRYLDVLGVRARGGSLLEARPPAKRQKASAGVLGEVANRLSAQGSEEGIARCLLEVVLVAPGRDIVRKASEVYLAAAMDSGDRRRRALLLLGACQCQVLCLERGREATPLPSATRGAMRAAVQGLMAALEGVVEAKDLRPLLQSLIAQKGLGQLRGAEEAMHLLCRIVEPIEVPACSSGQQVGNESGDSESEASELDNDDDSSVQFQYAKITKLAEPGIALDAMLRGNDFASRTARMASFVDNYTAEAAMVEGEAVEEDNCSQPCSPHEEFLAGLSFDASLAVKWPVLYPGPGSHGLHFHSNFEGGNLRRVRLESKRSVEILIRGDTNRSYHCQSFFFDVEADEPVEL
ncbi:unnamed protein product [Polarella glacialis]|uniref:PITH domain-containing protein n=1 Tax=Polarella glacialis TaxID=89957 RepID=A0A813JBA6_POLGL|nr:unnamed protein product [Polarella glacialis]